jgi:hypothetical protein
MKERKGKKKKKITQRENERRKGAGRGMSGG